MQQGIYGGVIDTSPNRDRVDCPKEVLRLWMLEFEVYGIGKGCAVVKARNAKQATSTLVSGGFYNGTPNVYHITRIEEIIEPPYIGLIAEQIVEIPKT